MHRAPLHCAPTGRAGRRGTLSDVSTDGSAPFAATVADVAGDWPVPVVDALLTGVDGVIAATRDELPAGPLLDLGTAAARAQVVAVAADLARPPHLRSGEHAGALGSYAAVVSCGGLAALPDLVGALRAVAALLAPGGWLVFSEPVGRPGTGRLVQASLEVRRPELRELHLGRDLTAALREAGFVISSVRRRRIEGAPLLLRYVAYGRAAIVPDITLDPSGATPGPATAHAGGDPT